MTPTDFIRREGLSIHSAFFELLERNGLASFSRLYGYAGGKLFKKNRFRSVVRMTLQDASGKEHVLHLKRHHPPVATRLKSILTGFNIPDGAENEWEMIRRLEAVGIRTMTPVAFGSVRRMGLPFRALTLTEDLAGAEKLEDFLPRVFGDQPLNNQEVERKRRIIRETARWAARFHNAGFSHQDFYLGHVFIRTGKGDDFTLHLIDLQRVRESRRPRPSRILKDLAQINFSALQLPCLTRTDRMRFIHDYLGRSRLMEKDKRLIRKVESKTRRIARHTVKMLTRRGLDAAISQSSGRRKN